MKKPESDNSNNSEINNTATNDQLSNTETNLTITDNQQQPLINILKSSSLERPSNSSTDNVSKPCVVELTPSNKPTINQTTIAEPAPVIDRPAPFVEIQLQTSPNQENNEAALTAEKKSVDGVKTIKRQSSKGWF